MSQPRFVRGVVFLVSALLSHASFAGESTLDRQRPAFLPSAAARSAAAKTLDRLADAQSGGEMESLSEKSLTNPNDLFFVRRDRNTTAVVNRNNTYDYQPSPMLNSDGTKDVWFCGGELDGSGNFTGHDIVLHAKLSSANALVGSITKAVGYSGNHGEPDGALACDVSVIKHGYPGVSWPSGEIDAPGEELLYLYYECAPYVTDRNTGRVSVGPAEICLAASADGGSTWLKHSSALEPTYNFGTSTTVPTPVIAKHAAIEALCDWAYNESPYTGQYVADLVPCDPVTENCFLKAIGSGYCDDFMAAYASGHPSAISMTTGTSQREVWLYYYDARGAWADRGLALAKSDDGIHFGTPIDLWVIDPDTGDPLLDGNGDPLRMLGGKVRYYNVNVAGHQGVFIATATFVKGYFSYSFDGINWVPAWTDISGGPEAALRVAEARSDEQDTPDMCVTPGDANAVADKYGWVSNLTNVELLTGEGKLGNIDWISGTHPAGCYSSAEDNAGRGSTWAMFSIHGDFGELIRTSVANACTHFDGKNVRDQKQRSEWLTGSQDSIFWIKDGKRYSYTSWADYLAKNSSNGYSFLNISNDSFDRVESNLECTSGGTRPTPVVATNDSAIVAKGLKTKISVLSNDTGAVDAATVAQVAAPSHGSLSISGAGVITYTHDGGVHTSDSFTYKVKDTAGLYSNTATVTVAIKAKSLLYRVNAGGSAVTQTGGNWTADTSASPSTYVNAVATGNYVFSVGGTITADGTVPSGTSVGMFNSSRYDQLASPNLIWSFPIGAGAGPEVEVKVYFAETFYTSSGQRKFAVKAEGVNFLTEFDIYAAAGAQGTMRGTATSTDGTLNVEFVAGSVSVPHLNGIEVWGPVP